ncbi:HAD family hydrolase [Halorussus halophilus]|uniref:HAD family hydrolase n=1 Tax=Halorussus halophilus TaxID=2650975 RepID=UPI0013018535|nr:HAD family hydrolase [Halorussus halophilus]
MPNSDIETILFDLDGTLVDYERPPTELLDHAFRRAGVEPFFEIGDYLDRFHEHTGPNVSIDEVRARCFEAIAESYGRDPEVSREIAEIYAAERDHSQVAPLPGAHDLLETLASEYRLGLVTNGPPGMQTTKLEAAGLTDYFEELVFAGHDTAAKPEAEPFEVALNALDSTPERTLHVGNSISSDVAGAHAAGVGSVWVPAERGVEPEPKPNYAFDSLASLEARPWAN